MPIDPEGARSIAHAMLADIKLERGDPDLVNLELLIKLGLGDDLAAWEKVAEEEWHTLGDASPKTRAVALGVKMALITAAGFREQRISQPDPRFGAAQHDPHAGEGG